MDDRLHERLGQRPRWRLPGAAGGLGRAPGGLPVAAVALASALGVLVVSGGGSPGPPAPSRALGTAVVTGGRPTPPAAATMAARQLLAGYLPFLYGQADATQLRAVTARLRRALAAKRDGVT